jgi:hypothetical protein
MCETNMKMYIYYANICRHKHEKNMTRLWCKIMLKISVEQTERNEGLYFYLYPFGDLVQGSLYVCIESYLKVNYELIEI